MQYPQVKAAVQSLQLDKEKFVQLYACPPPAEIKDRLLDILRREGTQEGNALLPQELRVPDPVSNKRIRETPVKQLNGQKKPSTDRIWKYVAAAFIILLLGSVFMNFFLASRSTDYKSRYKSLIAAREKLEADKEAQSLTSAGAEQKEADMLKDPAFKQIKIEGAGEQLGHVVTVCWNPISHALFLMAQVMPVPPAGKTYQLWAIHNKKLLDAGVFEGGAQMTQKIQEMKPMEDAEGFAITLENKGGSNSPTMNQVIMAASISR
ncbi:anti-sigma factor [Chitinophaga solisilvae]|uniref:anti-sigma factor n=1 Tax=Chitinophaga solisilvae TaxID=1233460 RepID=UPI00136AEF55|nr:anti-sigma factor [Chitinophaga solisilvae]